MKFRVVYVAVDGVVERLVVVEDVKVVEGLAKATRFVRNAVGFAVVPTQVFHKWIHVCDIESRRWDGGGGIEEE